MKKPKTNTEDTQQQDTTLLGNQDTRPGQVTPDPMTLSPSQALVLAIGGCSNARALRVNPHFRSRYFALSDLLDIVKPTFASYGLAVLQIPSTEDGRISISAQVIHHSGHIFHLGSVGIKSDGLTLQALGSAMSYLKRYQLATLCGVAADLEEDDGNSVTKQQQAYAHSKPQAPAIGQGNYQRQDDKKTVSPWFDWLTTEAEQQTALGILIRKGWLAPEAQLTDLPEQYVSQLRQPSMRQAFAKAVETELTQDNG
jgi:hypothetical protein